MVTRAGLTRALFWGTITAAVAAGLFAAFRPRPVVVDLVTVGRGDLVVTVDEDSLARVHDVHLVTAPFTGRLRRVQLHAGDLVVPLETVVAEIEAIEPAFLDVRSAAQAEAGVHAAESAQALARAEVERVQAEVEFAHRELDRMRELVVSGTVTQRAVDEAERANRMSRAALDTASAALDIRNYELERAKAALLPPGGATDGRPVPSVAIRSPIGGRVLRVLRQSEGVVLGGTELVEVGDPRDLEIVVDLLSADAVAVEPGSRVIFEHWGGDAPLEGRVRLVEPFGYTKLSALGIEEQRVDVIVDLVDPPEAWARLAHGYQLEARIVLWEGEGLVKVPLTALFRDGREWAVFVAADGVAQLRHVRLGRRSGIETEVVEGLEEGERIVLHPSDRVADGVRIGERG